MTPDLPINDLSDQRSADSELFRDAPVVGVSGERAYLAYGLFRNLGSSVSAAAHTAALFNHVSHVVGLGAEEQVIGTNAKFHIAPVKHIEPSRDGAIHDLPGKTMRSSHAAMKVKMAVGTVRARRPQPAFVAALDVIPEACNRLFVHGNSPSCGSRAPDVLKRRGAHCIYSTNVRR